MPTSSEMSRASESLQAVARKLAISSETVKVHRNHLYSKLGIKSQSELFALFLQTQRG